MESVLCVGASPISSRSTCMSRGIFVFYGTLLSAPVKMQFVCTEADVDVGINRNMRLIIAKTIPPNMIAAIPYVAMIAPPNIAPAIVPAFAAVRKRPFANVGASGAARVIQNWFIFALIPPTSPQKRTREPTSHTLSAK